MKPNEKPLWMADRFRGCLLGGAAGDALGYEVESKPLLPDTVRAREYMKTIL